MAKAKPRRSQSKGKRMGTEMPKKGAEVASVAHRPLIRASRVFTAQVPPAGARSTKRR
jgi:hypothetical protein